MSPEVAYFTSSAEGCAESLCGGQHRDAGPKPAHADVLLGDDMVKGAGRRAGELVRSRSDPLMRVMASDS